MATITFQQQSQPVPIQIQQQGVQLYPQYIRQPIPLLSVPVKLRQSVYSLSLILLVLGLICIIFGGICFGVLRYGIATVTGVNIWAGLMYVIAGSLGTAQYHNQINPSLMHAFYSSGIIALVFSIPHLIIGILAVSIYAVISGSISIVFALLGFSLSTAYVTILSLHLYCGQHGYFNQSQVASVNVNQPNMVMYQTNVAMQQSPISANPQPAFDTQMAYNPGSSMPSTVIMNAQISNTTNPMEKHLFTEPPVYSTTSS